MEALKRLKYVPKPVVDDTETFDQTDSLFYDTLEGEEEDTTAYVDPLIAVYYDEIGERIRLLSNQPSEIRRVFEYPTEAYREAWTGYLYYHILLDFSGEVVDYDLKIKSNSEEINQEANQTVASMIFDIQRIPTELHGKWMVYKFYVKLPDQLR
jgi:hypothetical protein